MESIQTDRYFLVWLSYPRMLMPLNDSPPMSPEYSCCRYRPPRSSLDSHVPVDSMGGVSGSIHDLVFVVQLPSRPASTLCGAPGVPTFLYISIMARMSILPSCFAMAYLL